MTDEPSEPKLYTLQEAADYLGVHPATIKYHLYRAKTPEFPKGHRYGRLLLWTERELDAWADSDYSRSSAQELSHDQTIVSRFAAEGLNEQVEAGAIRAFIDDREVRHVEKVATLAREYIVTYMDGEQEIVWNSKRIRVEN